MKKLIFLIALALFGLQSYSQGREIHGYYAQITIPTGDSICFDAICVKGSATGSKLFIEIDSILSFNIVKVGWDQTLGVYMNYKVFENYYAYGHYRTTLKRGQALISNYDVFDGVLETFLPVMFKERLALDFNVNPSRVTVSSFYYNYPSY